MKVVVPANKVLQRSELWVGECLSRRMRGGAVIAYTFDALGRPSTETMPLGGVAGGGGNLVTTTIYDLAGRTLSTSDTSGHTLTYAYDTAGRVTSNAITMPGISGARTIAYAYDAAGNRTRVTWPDAFYVDYAYDALSRMISASENGTTTLATYAYDRLSRRVGLTYGNGASVAYGRSWAGDLLSLVHAWGSDPNNLGGGTGVTFTHTYAPDHRLASTIASSAAFEWKPGTGGATALGTDMFNPANLLNQLTQVTLSGSAARSVTWDAAGNMLSDGVLTYVHDAENRLTSVARTTPALNATYTYDPLGRRVQRNVNGASTFTLHDGDEEIAEYDATGALIRRFIPGPGTDEPIAIVVPASGGGAPERRFFHEDRIGNVIAMSGLASGGAAPALAEGPFTYDAYGRSPQPLGTSATSTPFRYTGRRLDSETGNYYYRARFYSPTLGQFIETDPVGYADSLNLYAYVGGDPVNSVDPSGKCSKPRGEWSLNVCEVVVDVDGISPKDTERSEQVVPAGQIFSAIFQDLIGASNEMISGYKSFDDLQSSFSKDPIGTMATVVLSTASNAVGLGGATGALKLGWFSRGVANWGRLETLPDHFRRHGGDFGSASARTYANRANDFLRQSQRSNFPTKIDSAGVQRVYDPRTNTFGSYNRDGTTRTLFKPNDAKMYFDRQPGQLQ